MRFRCELVTATETLMGADLDSTEGAAVQTRSTEGAAVQTRFGGGSDSGRTPHAELL
jgi:hypothetical protein